MPYFDFLPYKVGNDIGKLMKPSAQLRYKYVMERNGESKDFADYPTDTTWQFKQMVALNPEAAAKITDFKVWNDEGDFTDDILQGNRLILVVQSVTKADRDRFTQINPLFEALTKSQRNIKPLVLTSSSPSEYDVFRHDVNLTAPFYYADATVLKSMIRSNPGLILLQNGVVKAKYHYHDIPDAVQIERLL